MDVNRKELSQIKDVIKNNPRGITVTGISQALNISRHSVSKYLEVLVTAGHVDMRSFGPSKVYYLSQRVPISAMLSLSSDLIITMGKDLRVSYVNDNFTKLLDLDKKDVLNKDIQTFSSLSNMSPRLEPYTRAALEGKEDSVDLFYNNNEGGLHFTMKSIPTVFEDGNKGVTLILSDITKRVKAEGALLKERNELEDRVKERTRELESTNHTLKAEIDQRIRSESALRESEEKYRNLTENINDAPWEIDTEGRFTYISPKIRDIMGYEPSDFIGKTIAGFLAPSHAKDIIENVGQIFITPSPYSLQNTYVLHKDGHEVVVEANAVVMYDERGAFKGYRGVIRDITRRKAAEEKLLQTTLELNAILCAFPDSIFLMRKDGTVIGYNGAGFDRMHIKPEAFINKNICDALPEDISRQFSEAIGQVNTRGKMVAIEFIRHINDRIEVYKARFQPVPGDQIVVILRPLADKNHV